MEKKTFYINKNNKQVTVAISKTKPHPVKTLIKILNKNAAKLSFNNIAQAERDALAIFVSKAMELFVIE